MQDQEPSSILTHFSIPEKSYTLIKISHGLINKSYFVKDSATNRNIYFLQQIDRIIFQDIEGIMQNIAIVTEFFKSLANPPNYLVTQLTINGHNYYKSEDGEYWRLYNYVEGHTFYSAENEQIAAEAGKMFGEFQNALSGIEPNLLKVTIPGFHDIGLRYEQFNESIKNAKEARKTKAAPLIDIVNKNIGYAKEIYHQTIHSCPSRITHNDTKLSNLLFDDNQRAICVVDYDTLMPGYLPLDFGDSVRTICSTTIEDSTDLKNTKFDMNLYQAFTKNFLRTLSDTITNAELKMLAKTVAYMPFLMGLRMLTDYLNNDVYYSTDYGDHNFVRASNQLTLFISGVNQLDEMNNIVEQNYPNSYKIS